MWQMPRVRLCLLAAGLAVCVALVVWTGCGGNGGGNGGRVQSDLRTTVCAGPLVASAGSTIQVSNGVRNAGDFAAGAFKLGVYLSADAQVTVDDVLLSDRAVDGLESEEETVAVSTLTIPAPTIPGTYYLGVIADYELVEPESDETNNALAAASAITITTASDVNLLVSDVSGPASAIPGNDITVDTTITNQGSTDAGAFWVHLYLSADAEVTVRDMFLGSRQVASLAGGANDPAGTTVTIPDWTTDGYYYLCAIADATGTVVESDETDNIGVSATQIVIGSPPAPDGYEVDDTAGQAKEITVDGGTQDRSFHRTTDEDWAWFLVSGGGGVFVTVDAPVSWYPSIQLYDADGETLLASGGSDLSYILAGPGTYYVRLSSFYSPFAYTVSVASFAPGGNADLTATGNAIYRKSGAEWFCDGWAFVGEPVLVTGAVENIGTDGAAGFTVDLYLSTDQAIDTSDIHLGQAQLTGLAAGDRHRVQVEAVIPSTTPPGAYYVGAIADAAGEVAETDKTNNAGASFDTVCLGIDLAANSVSAPASAGPGDLISFDYDISIIPDVLPASSAYARFYLSTDTTLDASDREFTGMLIPASGPGTTNDLLLSLGYPPAGTYYVILTVELDIVSTWRETNYDNNTVCSSDPMVMTGGAGADLIVSTVSAAPAALNPGEAFTVDDTVTNSGDVDAGGFSVAYELRLVGDWPTIDLGSRSVTSLNASDSDTASTPFTIPIDADGGYYELAAFADFNWEVEEKSEWNNVTIASDFVAVRGPDRWEPGNNWSRSAGEFYPDSSPKGLGMTIHEAGDVDWIMFYVETPGVTLKLETIQLLEGMDTVMELWRFDSPGSQVMAAIDDDSGGEAGASAITYTFPEARVYLLRVYHKDPSGTGFYALRSSVVQ